MSDPRPSGEKTLRDEMYAAQREELLGLLKSRAAQSLPLIVHGKSVLTPDDMSLLLSKIKNNHHFSSKERSALTEAGFNLDWLYPNL